MKDQSLSLYTPKGDLSAATTTTLRFSLSATASATKPSTSSSSATADLSKKHEKKSLKSVLASVVVEGSAVDLSPVSEVVENEKKSCNVEVVDPESTPESELISGDLLPLGTQSSTEVTRSKDVNNGMKKLMDALIDVLLKEVCAVPDGKEKGKYRVESLYSIRVCITFVSLILWIVVLAVVVLMMLGADDLDPWRIPPT
ncbi:hypothetical protein AKJ16_DCAP12660 [Drosera capensis]